MKKQLLYIIICLIGAGVGSSCRGPKLATANEQMERGEYFDASKTLSKNLQPAYQARRTPLARRGRVQNGGMPPTSQSVCEGVGSVSKMQPDTVIRFYPLSALRPDAYGRGQIRPGSKGPSRITLHGNPMTDLPKTPLPELVWAWQREGQTRYIVRNAKLFNSRRADYSPMYLDKCSTSCISPRLPKSLPVIIAAKLPA